jgi:hypothetical protein
LSSGQPHADNAVRAELLRLGLHARHRQLARVVLGLGEDAELLIGVGEAHPEAAVAHVDGLVADVVDAGADDHPEWIEPGLLEEDELIG